MSTSGKTYLTLKELFSKYGFLWLLVVLSVFSVFLYYGNITVFPSYIHAWTQSDRYALALGFLDNGFDFFHPKTYNLQTVDGITQVDFPLNEYLVAIIMKIANSSNPLLFRLYNLFVSFIGLFFLYKLTKKITASEIKSWVVVLFVFFSPVYAYYQIGFIPSIPALACFFTGMYFYFSDSITPKKKYFLLGLTFLLLAALIRRPFFIFLFAAFVHQLWIWYKKRNSITTKLFYFLAAFTFFFAYFLYNKFLAHKYGNIFIDKFMLPENIGQLKELLLYMYEHWLYNYFSKYHYILILILLPFLIYNGFIKKNIFSLHFINSYLLICFSGVLCYFIIMSKQFFAHDYYFLDSFFSCIILFIIIAISTLPLKNIFVRTAGILAIIFFSYFSFEECFKIQKERYTFDSTWDRGEITRRNFTDSEKLIDSLGIQKNEKALVIDAYTFNVPLILMNRKGYAVLTTSKENIRRALFTEDWDFVAIQDVFLMSDVVANYPFIMTCLKKIGGNSTISIYRKDTLLQSKTLETFLGINPDNIQFQYATDETVLQLDSVNEYGATAALKAMDLKNKSNLKILVECDITESTLLKGIQLVASVTNKDGIVYYHSFTLTDYFKTGSKKQKMQFQFVLSPFKTNEDELKVYLWNHDKSNLKYKKFKVTVYN